jgi:Tol biopolymer transport system component
VEIWVAGVAGGALARLTNDQGGNQWSPTWSPDSNYIAFFESTSRQVMKARVGASAAPEPIMDCARPGECLAEWSPKGDWIAVRSDARGIVLVSPDGKQQRVLRPTPYQSIVWKRDGTALIGVVLEQGQLRIHSLDVATATERLLHSMTTDIAFDAMYSSGVRLTLSPDGKTMLAGRRSVSSDLWMLERFYSVSTPWTRLRSLPQSILGTMR